MSINVTLGQLNTLNNTSILGQSNTNFNTIQTALTDAMSRSGQTPNQMNAAIDMNNNQIINLPAPGTVNSPARLIDVTSNPTIVVPGTGTSGHVVPFLDGNNTWSGTNTFSNTVTLPSNSITNSELAQMAAGTIKGNSTGSSATPQDLTTLPSSVLPSSVLQTNVTNTLTVGFTITPNNIGTVTTGTVTPNPALGNYQFYTNNGAHTLSSPSNDCAMDIMITNGASAGTITFSGFTVGTIGDSLTTSNTNKFIISIRRINSISTYIIKALQ